MAVVTVKFKDGTERRFDFESTYETNTLMMGQKAVVYDGAFVIIQHGDIKTSFPSETVTEVIDNSATLRKRYT